MKKIKVLHIVQSEVGGVAEYLKMLLKYMGNNKFKFYLIGSKQYESKKLIFEKLNCKVITIDMKRYISPINDIKSIIEIRNYIKKIHPDIIHVHSSKAGALGRVASAFLNIPIIYNAHGWAFDMNVSKKRKLIYAYVEKVLAKFTDVIVNISDHDKKSQMIYKIKPKRYTKVIYNGIDIERYKKDYNVENIKRELGISNNAFIIGMVARISKQKSPESFIEIARKLKEKLNNCYFILVGDGELRSEVQNLINKYNLKKDFLITGWTDEVPKYIALFDVGVLTSRWEGFGLVLAEYMAAKKPVVAFNSGGISDVVKNSYNGLLFNYGDINNFCDAVIRVKNDYQLREELIYNGYKVVNEKFNVKRVAKEHEKLYLDLLKIRN